MTPENLHPDQASSSRTEAAFGFLAGLGYQLQDRLESGGGSFRDGWRLVYATPAVNVTVQYFDMQFEVLFRRASVEAEYLFLDRELFGHRSGLQGNMFPPEKLGSIVDQTEADIREHYRAVLVGDDAEWSRIRRLVEAPKDKPRLP